MIAPAKASPVGEAAHEKLGAERVFAFLRDQLLAGTPAPGDRLLGERELALSLGVSRPVLREALRSLAILGTLDIRQGRGAFVRKADVSALGDLLTLCLAQQPDALDDVMQARVAIECQAIRLACVRAGDADLERIGGLLSHLVETLDAPDLGGEADFAFHLALVEASHSPALVTLYRAISGLLRRSHVERRAQTIRVPGLRDYLVDAHREVFLAIVARDPDAADARLREHFAIGDEFRRRSYVPAFAGTTTDAPTAHDGEENP